MLVVFGLSALSHYGVDMDKYIQALLTERAGYEKRGLTLRVQAVDLALREVGFDHKYLTDEIEVAAIQPEAERAVKKSVKKRKV